MRRFDFSYGTGMRWFLTITGMPPGGTYAAVDPDVVRVRAGIWFRLDIPRDRIAAVERHGKRYVSRGVHGWRGRWLVNASSAGLVRIAIEPRVGGWLLCWPLRVREVIVSLRDPDGFLAALQGEGSRAEREP